MKHQTPKQKASVYRICATLLQNTKSKLQLTNPLIPTQPQKS